MSVIVPAEVAAAHERIKLLREGDVLDAAAAADVRLVAEWILRCACAEMP